jgi:hypothetical protein
VQADWEQDDASEPDYVKNRPMINEVILRGNRELPEFPLTNSEIDEIFFSQVLSLKGERKNGGKEISG